MWLFILGLGAGVASTAITLFWVDKRRWKVHPLAQYAKMLAVMAPEEWRLDPLSHPDIGAVKARSHWGDFGDWWQASIGGVSVPPELVREIHKALQESLARRSMRVRAERISRELKSKITS